ncbi:MAG: DUF4347 domain-containing protein, partial [Gammaproteobacteria bacterium]
MIGAVMTIKNNKLGDIVRKIKKIKKKDLQKNKLSNAISSILSLKTDLNLDQSTEISILRQALEPRYMFDGAAVETVDLADEVSESEQGKVLEALNVNDNTEAAESLLELTGINNSNLEKDYSVYQEVVIFDSRVKDPHTLIEDISRKASVEIIDIDENGVDEIARILSKYNNLDAVHIISHGNQGELYLGNTVLNSASLSFYKNQLATWGQSFSSSGDLLFYGCNVAEGEKGLAFIDALKGYTDADIAASTDLTGGEELGGDSILEIDELVETEEIVDFEDYEHLLANVNTGNWSISDTATGGTATNTTSGITTTLTFTQESSNSITNLNFNQTLNSNTSFWHDSSVANSPSLRFTFVWDTSDEDGPILATDDGGTSLLTITFSTARTNPIINFDRVGGAGNGVSNGALFTLISGGTLTKLSGVNHLDVTSTTVSRTPFQSLNGSPEASTNPGSTAAGSVQVNGTFTTIQFRMSGIGYDGTGNDGIEIGLSFDNVINDPPDINTSGAGDSAVGNLTETDNGLSISDTLTVEDTNTTDTVPVNVISVVESGTTSGIANATLLNMLSIVDSNPILNSSETSDQFTWQFDSGAEAFDYLSVGETLTLTYTLEADDGTAQDTQTVTINIAGTNDASELALYEFQQLGNDINGEAAGDESGNSISFSADGNIVAIGAAFNDGANGVDSGHVRIYQWNGSSWIQIGSDIDGANANDQFGYSVVLSNDGQRLVIGAFNYQGAGTNIGQVSVFEYNGTDWVQLGSSIDGDNNARLGTYLDFSGDGNVFIASEIDQTASIRPVVYEYNGTDWVQRGVVPLGSVRWKTITISDDGERIALGAPLETSNSGRVRIYDWDGANWNQVGGTIAGLVGEGRLGTDLDFNEDGSRIVIGERHTNQVGNTLVYEYNGSAWVQVGTTLTNLGQRVAMRADGELIAVGDENNDQVRIFKWNGTDWSLVSTALAGEASGDRYGWDVALGHDATRLAVGANLNDGNGADSGHVRIYELTTDTASTPVIYTEGDPATQVYPFFSVVDPDDTNIESATIAITGGTFTLGEDYLAFTDTANITGSFNASTGILTLIGTDTKAAYELALASVTYENVSDNPDTTQRQIDFYVNDGDVQSNVATVNIDVVAVNDAPEVYVDIEQIGSDITGIASGDNFGASVAYSLDGTRVAVGSPFYDGGGSNNGSVSVYEFDGTSWNQVGSTIEGASTDDHLGRSVALDEDGSRLIVGAYQINGNAGYVGVYEFDGSNWNQVGVDIPGENSADENGRDVSISADGNIIAMGARKNPSITANGGHIRVYEWDGLLWNKTLEVAGSVANGQGGSSVELSSDGNRVVFELTSGQTVVYENLGGTWSQLGSIIPFSEMVTINATGTRIAIGSPDDSTAGTQAGRVQVYEHNGTDWVQLGSDILGEFRKREGFVSFDESGNRLAISGSSTGGTHIGRVTIYDWDEIQSEWIQVEEKVLGNTGTEFFGSDVELSADGSQFVVGSPGDANGRVQIYSLEAIEKTINYTENDAATVLDNSFIVTDVDDTNLESATVTITNFNASEDILSFNGPAPGGIIVNISTPGTLIATGSASLADYEAFFESVTYENSSDDPDLTQREITFIGDDGNSPSNIATIYVDITATNDPPVALASSINTDEDTAHTFSSGEFNFSDVDTGDALESITVIFS